MGSRQPSVVLRTGLPVKLSEAKSFLRVTHDDDDLSIDRMLRAAINHVETVTGRTFFNTDFKLFLECFPDGDDPIDVPRTPMIDLDTLSYYDTANATKSLNVSTQVVLFVDGDGFGLIRPTAGTTWPGTYDRPDAVTLTFSAGYTTTAIPEPARQAILLLLSHWYDNRESVVIGATSKPLEHSLNALLWSLKTGYYARTTTTQ